MSVTRSKEGDSAGVVMVAKWCLSRGEKVTIIVPAGSSRGRAVFAVRP